MHWCVCLVVLIWFLLSMFMMRFVRSPPFWCNFLEVGKITTLLRYRFSAFWLRSKCSICSYQLNIWYVPHWGTSILNWFLQIGEMSRACSALATGWPGIAVPPGIGPLQSNKDSFIPPFSRSTLPFCSEYVHSKSAELRAPPPLHLKFIFNLKCMLCIDLSRILIWLDSFPLLSQRTRTVLYFPI